MRVLLAVASALEDIYGIEKNPSMKIQRPLQSQITDEFASISFGVQGLKETNLLQEEGQASDAKSSANFAEFFRNIYK